LTLYVEIKYSIHRQNLKVTVDNMVTIVTLPISAKVPQLISLEPLPSCSITIGKKVNATCREEQCVIHYAVIALYI